MRTRLWIPAVLFLLLGISCQSRHERTLSIAAAANTRYAMAELIDCFELQEGFDCDMTVSSSGKLAAQIREGAPYQVFVSADMRYPARLHQENLTMGAPQIYAMGRLVLWTNVPDVEPSLSWLREGHWSQLAIANPDLAPYGVAAVAALQHFGLYEKVKDRLVYGESIAQTNQYIRSGNAEAGLTALSVIKSPELQGVGQWIEMPVESYSKIEQGAVIIKKPDQETASEARAFYEFLFSKEARDILHEYGYELP